MNQLATDTPPTIKKDTSLAADELHLLDAYWRACNYLSLGMLYLRENPLLREPLRVMHIKKRSDRTLGFRPRSEFYLGPPEPADHQLRLEHDLHRRPRARCACDARERVSRRHLLRGVSGHKSKMSKVCADSSNSSRFQEASAATALRKRPVPSMRAANWDIACRTRSARRLTTPICSSPSSSETAKPKPVH